MENIPGHRDHGFGDHDQPGIAFKTGTKISISPLYSLRRFCRMALFSCYVVRGRSHTLPPKGPICKNLPVRIFAYAIAELPDCNLYCRGCSVLVLTLGACFTSWQMENES